MLGSPSMMVVRAMLAIHGLNAGMAPGCALVAEPVARQQTSHRRHDPNDQWPVPLVPGPYQSLA